MKRTATPAVKKSAAKAVKKAATKKPAKAVSKSLAKAAGKAVSKVVRTTTKKTAGKTVGKSAGSTAGKAGSATQSAAQQADAIVAWLRKNATKATRDGMARYSLPSDKAFGVPVNVMLKEGKRLGRNHDVAMALWDTGWFEARMMATYLGQPERMTSAELDKWCNESDNWGICDTAGWHVYEKSPHAWAKIEKWGKQSGEWQKRSSLALLATIALHDKTSGDAQFANALPLVETSAHDERNFVFKAANWALRAIGLRSKALKASCQEIAERLAEAPNAGARWAGKDALKKLSKAKPKK